MKNILLVNSALHIGGAERVIANLAKQLDPQRFRVTVCYLKNIGTIGEELLDQGYQVVGIRRHEFPVLRYFSFLKLLHLVKQHQIDLIHSHSTYALIDSALVRLFSVGRVKLVHTFHYGNYPWIRSRYKVMEWLFSRIADRLVTVGIEQEKAVRSTFHLPREAISTILNGVEDIGSTGSEPWRAQLRNDGRIVIASISTFIEQKGLTYLIDVIHLLRQRGVDVLFVIVGEGPLRAEIEQKSRRLGLSEALLFAGWVDRAGSEIMPLIDIFVQTSLWEAMSMVVLEAMAAGKPVVVTNVGDNRHIVRHGETGIVVEPRDVEAMTDALQKLIQSAELRKQLGSKARAIFEERYTAQVMARKYDELYCRVLAES